MDGQKTTSTGGEHNLQVQDLNPIENVWGSMKNYLCTHAKPKNTDDLRAGILGKLPPAVCKRYVGHLRKVIPKVIESHALYSQKYWPE